MSPEAGRDVTNCSELSESEDEAPKPAAKKAKKAKAAS